MPNQTLRLARAVALIAPLLLLGGAYLSQYGFGLYPCEMCWWQRYPHIAALGFALAAFLAKPGRLLVVLAAMAIAVSGAMGLWHAGVEYRWWEGLSACTSPVASGGDPLDAVLNAPMVRCDTAPWSLLGISLAGWNFLFSCAAVLLIGLLLTRPEKTDA